MNQRYFARLMEAAGRENPSKEFLRTELIHHVQKLLPSRVELQMLNRAFDISFDGHQSDRPRESGEAYFFHIFRTTLMVVEDQIEYGVFDFISIIDALLHDRVEDANNPLYAQGEILMSFGVYGGVISLDVYYLTKLKQLGETNEAYFARQIAYASWRVIFVKVRDRTDNMLTIDSVSPERREKKIRETLLWSPRLEERLTELINREVERGFLDPKWRAIPPSIFAELNRIVAQKKRRYGIT